MTKTEDSLVCPICVDFADEAHTTVCCNQVYCGSCIVTCISCPTCRSTPVKHTPNPFLDRLIAKIETECTSCNAKIDRIDFAQHTRSCNQRTTTCPDCRIRLEPAHMAAHAFKCPQRLISCPHPDCNTTHPGTAVLMHIAFDHPEIVNHASVGAIAQLMLESPEGISGEVTCPKGRCAFKASARDVLLHVLTHHEKDVDSTCIKQAINVLLKLNDTPSQSSSGRPAEFTDPRLPIQNLDSSVVCRLGKTGKFYCGKAMWFSTDCTCCEGNCGTISGSNCKSCMQLDLAARRLPKGYLVNSDGFPSRRSNGATGHFYCGRRMPELVKNSECDGSCGPSNGPNCLACQCLDRCSTHAYRTLL